MPQKKLNHKEPIYLDYESLFQYIPYFEQCPSYEWQGGKQADGTIQFSFPVYDDAVIAFEKSFYASNLAIIDYMGTIQQYGIAADKDCFTQAIPTTDDLLLRAMLTFFIRKERFCDGFMSSAIKNGTLASILKRIKELQTVKNKQTTQ